ncbi:hypothetical protein V5799_022316 [Amblyomma americanum]|uniref:Uncharacterized protein n=1 Tax=Amblyomma americanum TaxID=6943 RepID=A0AAQ4FKT1_AMBAM
MKSSGGSRCCFCLHHVRLRLLRRTKRWLLLFPVRLMHSSPPTATEGPGAAAQRSPAAVLSSRGCEPRRRRTSQPPRLLRRLRAEERRVFRAELQLLEGLHAHYIDVQWAMQQVTWLRKRHPVVTTRLDNGEQRCLGRGVYFAQRPCFGCYRKTFFGLKKPRNRV